MFFIDKHMTDIWSEDRTKPYQKYGSLPVFFIDGGLSDKNLKKQKKLRWEFNGKQGTLTAKIQGNWTKTDPKKNYKISDFDDKIDFGWGNQYSTYILKADYSDCSHAKNVVGAKLWGGMVRDA